MRLDPALFRSDAVPREVMEFNEWLEADLAGRPSAMEVGHDRARQAREEGKSVFGKLDVDVNSIDLDMEGPAGQLTLHVLEPEDPPTGAYLHLHGGGWVLGAAHHHDRINRTFTDQAGVVVVSVEYRLAPEAPHPAARDDCVAAAEWLRAEAPRRWGTDRLLIGGESAGAHLAVLTLLAAGPGTFDRALLSYGIYDASLTPSARLWGERGLILSTPAMEWFVRLAHPDGDLQDPSVSPLYAELTDLVPARFVVGTLDPLLDDTLLMATRWTAAGNDVDLAVYPGAVHAFDYFPHHPYAEEATTAAVRWLRGG